MGIVSDQNRCAQNIIDISFDDEKVQKVLCHCKVLMKHDIASDLIISNLKEQDIFMDYKEPSNKSCNIFIALLLMCLTFYNKYAKFITYGKELKVLYKKLFESKLIWDEK